MAAKKIILNIIVLILLLNFALAATKTFRVDETDFVKINPKTIDLDNDKVTYKYSEPLDEEGEWQTDYEDAGEYNIKITASDGESETFENIKLIVNDKNEPPFLTEKVLTIKEKQEVDIKDLIKDPNEDILVYNFKTPFNKEGVWKTNYGDAGTHTIDIIINDGEFEVKERLKVEVLPTNRPPIIEKIFSEEETVDAKEGINFRFFVIAEDKDGDKLNYTWELDGKIISTEELGNFIFDYNSSGEHNLHLCLNDGTSKLNKSWVINVKNTNRKPKLEINDLTINEGNTLILNLSKKDLDNDNLTYTFSSSFNEKGIWEVGFEDAGKHKIKIIADDGEYKAEKIININVIDVDRAPQLILPKKLDVSEGEKLSWKINVSDPDKDKIKIKFKNAPVGSLLNQNSKTFTWEPDFNTLKRNGGFISNVLNSLRLEHFLIKKKVEMLEIEVCGKDLCSSGIVPLNVYNVNRGPTLDNLKDIIINETQELIIKPIAYDPDGDIVKFFFSEPVTRREGTWKTSYEDEGTYTVQVTASDGKLEHTLPVNITITKKNRQPSISVETDKLIINEGKEFTFVVKAKDPDNDNLTVKLDDLPEGASFKDGILKWSPLFNTVQNKTNTLKNNLVSSFPYLNKKLNSEKTTKWLSFSAFDGEIETIHPVKVTVKNVNQPPKIIDYLPVTEPIEALVNEPIVFHVLANDADGDQLSYRWELGLRQGTVKGTNTIERTFVTPGKKKVKLVVSDGRNSIEKKWVIEVSEQEINSPVANNKVEVTNFKVYVVDQ